MAAFWRRNRAFIALTVATLVLTGLIVATAGDENMSGFEKYTAGALAPVQEAIARMVEFIRGFAENVGELRTLAADFRQQQSELEALRLQFNYLVEVKRENERLLQMLNYTQTTPQSRYVMARVIAYAPVSWQQEIVIDRGENDGITTGMAVITSTGLVGRVYETTPTTAKVVSVVDPRSAVSVRVQETRVLGTLEGSRVTPGMGELVRLSKDAEVYPGNTVLTSGMGGVLPPGLIIGTVETVGLSPDGLMKVVAVKPAADFSRLEEVLVVVSSEVTAP